jgi:hypothetical protein
VILHNFSYSACRLQRFQLMERYLGVKEALSSPPLIGWLLRNDFVLVGYDLSLISKWRAVD